MKFTDGYWMVRKGYEIQNPAEIRDIVTDDASMTVYRPPTGSSIKEIR